MILPLQGKTLVRNNPYSGIFYTVKDTRITSALTLLATNIATSPSAFQHSKIIGFCPTLYLLFSVFFLNHFNIFTAFLIFFFFEKLKNQWVYFLITKIEETNKALKSFKIGEILC